MIPVREVSEIGNFIETESKIEVTRGWGQRRMGSYCLMGKEFPSGMFKMFWRWIVVLVPQPYEGT